MTTNTSEPVKTAKSPVKPEAKKSTVSAAASVPKKVAVEPKKVPVSSQPSAGANLKLSFDKAKFAKFDIVRLYLKEAGQIQYDPSYPELVLDVAGKPGKLLPLTPFFKSRIGKTLEIVLTK